MDYLELSLESLHHEDIKLAKKIENSYVNIVKHSPRFFGLLYKAGAKISNPKVKSIIYVLERLNHSKSK